MAATDAITIGGQFYYAAGDDEDVQYTGLGNGFNGWDPIFDVGASLSNEAMDLGDNRVCDSARFPACGSLSDWTGLNAGAMGGRLYASMKAGGLQLSAHRLLIWTTEEADDH